MIPWANQILANLVLKFCMAIVSLFSGGQLLNTIKRKKDCQDRSWIKWFIRSEGAFPGQPDGPNGFWQGDETALFTSGSSFWGAPSSPQQRQILPSIQFRTSTGRAELNLSCRPGNGGMEGGGPPRWSCGNRRWAFPVELHQAAAACPTWIDAILFFLSVMEFATWLTEFCQISEFGTLLLFN